MYASDVIKIAENEIGYLEKKTADKLDDKTANAGTNNYTKFGKYFGVNPAAWCDYFVDWCFCQAFGKEKAKELLHGFSGYTPTSASYFKKAKQYFKSPHRGDVIFYKNSTRICHTGIVYAVDEKYVYTIEGNTSGASGVIANGGGVCKKKYLLSYSRIAGYGRPKYDNAVMIEEPTTNVKLNQKGDGVRWVQEFLNLWGYTIATDGIFGKNTLSAVTALQKTAGLDIDGVVGKKTRAALKRVE